jgi:hypothetical protein
MALGHVPLAVAAHLARAQLVPDPGKVYDAQHLSEMLNVLALALARSAPLYLPDPGGAEGRRLSVFELQGATAQRSASVLVLRDGRELAGVTMRREDLRSAIAALKALGPANWPALPRAASPR